MISCPYFPNVPTLFTWYLIGCYCTSSTPNSREDEHRYSFNTLSCFEHTHTGAKLSHILLPLRWTVVQSEAAFRSKGTYVTSHTVTPSLASGLCVCACVCALGVAAVLGPEDIY